MSFALNNLTLICILHFGRITQLLWCILFRDIVSLERSIFGGIFANITPLNWINILLLLSPFLHLHFFLVRSSISSSFTPLSIQFFFSFFSSSSLDTSSNSSTLPSPLPSPLPSLQFSNSFFSFFSSSFTPSLPSILQFLLLLFLAQHFLRLFNSSSSSSFTPPSLQFFFSFLSSSFTPSSTQFVNFFFSSSSLDTSSDSSIPSILPSPLHSSLFHSSFKPQYLQLFLLCLFLLLFLQNPCHLSSGSSRSNRGDDEDDFIVDYDDVMIFWFFDLDTLK